MALMGWSYDDQTEFFTLPDLVEKFDLDRLNPAAAAINFTKFDHFNGLHIRQLETSDLSSRLRPFYLAEGVPVNDSLLLKIVPLIQERIVTLDEAPQISGFFFRDSLEINPEQLVGKALSVQESRAILSSAQTVLEGVENFTAASLESRLRSLVEDLQGDARQVFGILRVAVTGQQVSPPLFESMEIIGRRRVLERVIEAQNLLAQLDGP
jgi:glutamyl-tRNA synthetase